MQKQQRKMISRFELQVFSLVKHSARKGYSRSKKNVFEKVCRTNFLITIDEFQYIVCQEREIQSNYREIIDTNCNLICLKKKQNLKYWVIRMCQQGQEDSIKCLISVLITLLYVVLEERDHNEMFLGGKVFKKKSTT